MTGLPETGCSRGQGIHAYQEGERGIADALRLAEGFADGGRICVVLGDNLIQNGIRRAAETFSRQPSGARLLLKAVRARRAWPRPTWTGC